METANTTIITKVRKALGLGILRPQDTAKKKLLFWQLVQNTLFKNVM